MPLSGEKNYVSSFSQFTFNQIFVTFAGKRTRKSSNKFEPKVLTHINRFAHNIMTLLHHIKKTTHIWN